MDCVVRINRIRLEFKVQPERNLKRPLNSINRIRLEFKAKTHEISTVTNTVLIESDWNLKNVRQQEAAIKR